MQTEVSSRTALARRAAELADDHGLSIATAESLTSGGLASTLGAAPDSSRWFCGGVVAYRESVKFQLLGVDEGPVVTAACAAQMATGVRRLLDADVAVSATGVGGPEPSEGEPPGTVYLGLDSGRTSTTTRLDLEGDPEDVLDQTVDQALQLLVDTLEQWRD